MSAKQSEITKKERQTVRKRDRLSERETDSQKERQTVRKRDRQSERETDRQSES
jgi:hypothetical protein